MMHAMSDASLEVVLCRIARRAYRLGLVEGTAGNFSVRLDQQRVLCTPTAVCKGDLRPVDLCVVDLGGRQLAGERAPSSEIGMHLEIYTGCPSAGAVAHCHPPYATTLAVLGQAPPSGLLPEGDILLGPVPLIPYQTPGTRSMGRVLQPYLAGHTAALLQNHGTVVWAGDLRQACLLTETLEAVCRVYWQARLVGVPQLISPDQQAELARRRRVGWTPPT